MQPAARPLPASHADTSQSEQHWVIETTDSHHTKCLHKADALPPGEFGSAKRLPPMGYTGGSRHSSTSSPYQEIYYYYK
jgi:hypothetical protein